jgi:hypothetical protein
LIFSSYVYAFAATDVVLSPAGGTFDQGSTFSVSLNVTNNTQAINAVSGGLTFPTDILEVKSISKDNSIIQLWAEEPSFSNTNGSIKFEGVILNPGFSGTKGKVLTIVFKAKKAGDASVIFGTASVLANDGEATNILQNLGNGNYTVSEVAKKETEPKVSVESATRAPVITSTTYPDSNLWYASRDASFAWDIPKDVVAVRTLYGNNEDSVPTKVYDPPINNRSFKTDADGIQYMHVQFKGGDGWGDVSTFRFQVDTKPPEELHVAFPDGVLTVNPHPTISVIATDALSGVDKILVIVDTLATSTFQVTQNNLYQLPETSAGKHTVTVYAVDKAGNSSKVSLDYSVIEIAVPTITDYTKHAQVGEVLKVMGTTYPSSVVELVFIDQEGVMLKDTTTSDVNGAFTLLWSKKLNSDIYEMKARVVDSRGATSGYTQPKVVVVERQSYLKIGMFIMNWLSLILIIIVAIICVIATLWFSFVQFGRFRRRVRRTMKEVENTLRTNVAALRRDTEEFHTVLVKAEKKRPLTKEEQAILKKFKKRLEITEKEIEKKLEQIG